MDKTFLAVVAYATLLLLLRLFVFNPIRHRHLILQIVQTGPKSLEEIYRKIQLLPIEVQELLEGMVLRRQVVRISDDPTSFSITPYGLRDLRFYAHLDRD